MEEHVLIAIPRTESGLKRLADLYIHSLFKSFETIMLPLPRGLCAELVKTYLGGGSYDESIAAKYLNDSLEKLWRPVLESLAHVIRYESYLEKSVTCYLSDDYIKSLEDRAVRLGYLLYKANVFGNKKLDEWVDLFKDRDNEGIINETLISALYESSKPALIVDNYRALIEAQSSLRLARIHAVMDFYPAPTEAFDVMVNITKAPEQALAEAVDWIISYLNDLKLSKSFDELYAKYLLNEEYIKFLSRNKLFVIPSKETLL